MELATPHVAMAHDARKAPRVVRARQYIGGIGVVGHRVAVGEVHIGALGKTGKQRIGRTGGRHVHLVPPHVRHLQAARLQVRARTAHNAQAIDPGAAGLLGGIAVRDRALVRRHALVAALKKQLKAQADTEQRSSGGNGVEHRICLAALAHKGDRVVERAHARDDQAVGVTDLLRVVRRTGNGTGTRKPAHDARQVALVVVDHHDLRFAHATLPYLIVQNHHKGDRHLCGGFYSCRNYSEPLVLGMPCTRGSNSQAWRIVRPTALKAASIMWCELPPASSRTWSVSLASRAKA